MADLEEIEDFIREKVERNKWTHVRLSRHLQELYPGMRGFSIRSLERFCSNKGIHKTSRLSAGQIDEVVGEAVAKVRLHVTMYMMYTLN